MTNTTESKIQMAMQNYTFFLLIAPNASRDTYSLFKKVYLSRLSKTKNVLDSFYFAISFFQKIDMPLIHKNGTRLSLED